MSSSLRRIDVIYKAEYTLVVGIVMLESNLNINIIFLTLKIEDILIERGLTVVQIGDELLDSTLVEELYFLLLLRSVFFFLLLSLVCLFE